MSDENEIRCPGCDKPMQRLSTRSEPEGIRGDAYCSTCGVTYMVTKAGCVKLPYPPAVATKDGGAPARPSTTSPAAPAPTELPELDERHQAIAQQSATYFNTFRREADAITAVVSALVSRTHRMVLVKEIENAIATAEDSDSPRTDACQNSARLAHTGGRETMSNKPRFTNAGVNFSTGEIHFTASGPTEPTATPAAPLDGEAREEEVATLTRELEAMRGVVEAAVKVNRAWYAYPLAARDYLPVFERKRMPELTQALSNWTAAVPPTEGETPE